MVEQISNRESGLSVRQKLNNLIDESAQSKEDINNLNNAASIQIKICTTEAELLALTGLDDGDYVSKSPYRYVVDNGSEETPHAVTTAGAKLFEVGSTFSTLDRLTEAGTAGYLSGLYSDGDTVSVMGNGDFDIVPNTTYTADAKDVFDIAGGLQAVRKGVMFHTRTVASATQTSALDDGTTFSMAGLAYQRDDTVLLADSALSDLGIAGVKPALPISSDHFGGGKAGIQRALDYIAGLSAPWARGDLSLDRNVLYPLTDALIIDTSGTHLNGLSAKWEGAEDGSMVRIVNSERAHFSDFFLSGDDTNPPLAAIWLDAPSVEKYNNANITIERGVIGRALTTEAASGEIVKNGIFIGGAIYGNNDEFIIRDVNVHDATVAGINIDSVQSIWGRIEGGLLNACDIGLLTGANTTLIHPTFNRNVTADIDAFRDIDVWVTGMQSENSKVFARSRQNASIYIKNGKLLRNNPVASQFFDVQNGGNLVLQNLLIRNAGGAGDTIRYRSGSSITTDEWKISVSNCEIDGGSLRNTWDIHTALAGVIPTRIDIKHGTFEWVTDLPYIDVEVDFSSIADDISGTGTAVAASTLGHVYNAALSVVHGGHITDAPDSVSVHRSKLWNVTGSALDLDACRLRIADLSECVDYSVTHEITAGTLANGSGYTETVSLAGVRLGDFVATTAAGSYYSSQYCSYVSSDGDVSVRVHNATGGTNIPAATDFTVAKLDASKMRFKGSASYAGSTVVDDTTLEIDVAVEGAQVGSHAFFAYSADFQGLFVSAEVTAADTVTVRMTNKTGGDVTLASGLMRAGVLF